MNKQVRSEATMHRSARTSLERSMSFLWTCPPVTKCERRKSSSDHQSPIEKAAAYHVRVIMLLKGGGLRKLFCWSSEPLEQVTRPKSVLRCAAARNEVYFPSTRSRYATRFLFQLSQNLKIGIPGWFSLCLFHHPTTKLNIRLPASMTTKPGSSTVHSASSC